jgi:gluconate 2-dehydrogenase gamma chain
MSSHQRVDRREFVAGVSAGFGSIALTTASGQEPAWWRFFTHHESRLVDAIAEQIIPADHDAGAHDAGVVNFIDKQLVGHYHRFAKSYRRGLIGVEESAQSMFNSGFLDLGWDQQTKVLSALEAGNAPGGMWQSESSAAFFRLIRNHTMQGFYGSPRHGGNHGYVSYRMLEIDYPQIIGRSRYRGK